MKSLILCLAVLASACAGDMGAIGPEGDPGEDGTAGPPGRIGDQGQPGPQGPEGPTGPRGLQGEQGTQGVTGTDGSQGAQGVQGPQGTQGVTGNTGSQGPAGTPGTQGSPGPSLYITNESGVQLGHPMHIDRGTGSTPAFYATQDSPAATFPQGWIVSGTPVSGIYYSGFSCDGSSYIAAAQSSAFHANVLYTLGVTNELWDASGPANSRSINSVDFGTGCGGAGPLVTGYVATKTTFVIDLDPPWTTAAY